MTPAECHRLVMAAQALLDENTEVAMTSFQEHAGNPRWSDAMWARGDERNARLCIELRRALKAVPKVAPRVRKWEGPGSRAEIEDYEAGK